MKIDVDDWEYELLLAFRSSRTRSRVTGVTSCLFVKFASNTVEEIYVTEMDAIEGRGYSNAR